MQLIISTTEREGDLKSVWVPDVSCDFHPLRIPGVAFSSNQPAEMAATTALREALNSGISSGSFIDTKIILFSRRDSSGRVCRPKALYANSHVLKTVPYFNDRECTVTFDAFDLTSQYRSKVLFGDFGESQSKEFGEAIDDEESTEDYGYSSDSDLEDDEDAKVLPSADLYLHIAANAMNERGPKDAPENCKERAEKGKVVRIPDIAFVT